MTEGGALQKPGDGESAKEGQNRHVPVLLDQVLAHLRPEDDEIHIDGTFGAGGYTRAILEAADCHVLAIDRDRQAIADGVDMVVDYSPRLTLVEGRFADMASIAAGVGLSEVNGIVLDIGVSSMHLDEAARGFSFMRDGPLDMRMSQGGVSAADVLASLDEGELADIFYYLGEERRARAIARAIVKTRQKEPLKRTGQLADLIAGVLGRRPSDPKHPATRCFQALRIYVNDELGQLSDALIAAEGLLKPSGRLVVVTFHSLEDRIVKRFFATRCGKVDRGSRHMPQKNCPEKPPSFQFVNRRPVSPETGEVSLNARARSARLRAVRRTDAPAWGRRNDEALNIPRLVQ